ncbi:MAG: SDR family NAD(P)-dependent oxidoreductase [Terricaulis sp.]
MKNSPDAFARYPSLEDKVVFISGGTSGIGASLVEHFAKQGAKVGFAGRTESLAPAVIAACGEVKHTPLFRRCDVTDIPDLKSAIAETASALGDIQVLVNNAATTTATRPRTSPRNIGSG